jgi:uncharacterized membrane protein
MLIPTLILTILATASFSAASFSMLQQIHSDSVNAQTHAHLVDCKSHFFALQKSSQKGLQYINNNCADILNTTLVKQLLPAV